MVRYARVFKIHVSGRSDVIARHCGEPETRDACLLFVCERGRESAEFSREHRASRAHRNPTAVRRRANVEVERGQFSSSAIGTNTSIAWYVRQVGRWHL